jgi:hypothetical protein
LNKVGNRFRVNPRAIWRVVDGEAVILDLDGGQYFGLNQVGTRIWELLKEGRSSASIRALLSEEYDAGEAELDQDIALFIQELVKMGLAEVDEGNGEVS